MTYDAMKLNDGQMLDILALARREGALVMVHAENHDMIQWLAHHLLEQGHGAPQVPRHRPCPRRRGRGDQPRDLAGAAGRCADADRARVGAEAIETIRQAQTKGLKIYGETCPQYSCLTADDMDKPGVEGAKWCCSPPPRDAPRRRRCGRR